MFFIAIFPFFPKLHLPHNIHTRRQLPKFVLIKLLYTFSRHCWLKHVDMRLRAFIWRRRRLTYISNVLIKIQFFIKGDSQYFQVLFREIIWSPILMLTVSILCRDNRILWNLPEFAVAWFSANHWTALAQSLSSSFWSTSRFLLELHKWLSSA